MNTNSNAAIIQRWWKRTNSITALRKIKSHLQNALTHQDLQELANKCNSITNVCKGDGAGLLGGCLIDMLICRFFKKKLPEYQEYHSGENDMKICGIPFSQKKINGKSTIALDWSKNEKAETTAVAACAATEQKKERFSSHIIIINLKTEQWWKKKPTKPSLHNEKIDYTRVIPSGIYIIDRNFCKKYIALSSNNKTNTLIDAQSLYIMLLRSISQNLVIQFPKPNKNIEFDILLAFADSSK
jgi:hypothetical protein